MKLQVVILTGGREGHQQLLADTDLSMKVLLPVAGKPMVQRVFEQACQSTYQPEIYLSAGAPEISSVAYPQDYTLIPSGQNAIGSVLGAIDHLMSDGQSSEDDWILFISGDHPLITT